MKHTEFSIQMHIDRLSEVMQKKSCPLKYGGIMLESMEIIQQLRKERDAAKAQLPENMKTLISRDTAAVPEKESLADRNCPACGAGISWDALNDPMREAPAFCNRCGQRFDWSKESKYEEW